MIRHDDVRMEIALLPVKNVFHYLCDLLPRQPLRTLPRCIQIVIHPHERRTAIHFSRRRIALPRQTARKIPSDKQIGAFVKNMRQPPGIIHYH